MGTTYPGRTDHRFITRVAVLAGLVLLAGCSNLGPRAIQGSRTDYNLVLRQTDDEQVLLNLVRLRYRDRPLFLEVSALNTQFTFGAGAEAGAEGGDEDRFGLAGRVAVEEKPTVTYTPLQGGEFVERVLTPIRMETLFLLDTSGWSAERVFRTLLEQMNGLRNARGASGPTPQAAPEFREFVRVTRLLYALEQRHQISGVRIDGELALRFAPEARESPEYLELTELLGIDPKKGVYRVTTTIHTVEPDVISLRFRSFAGVMYFLSQSVEVPARDVEAGRVTVTRDESGQPFDWVEVTEGLMRIRSSDAQPDNASVAVRYRDSWFYIDDADLDSKSTFSMLGQLFALQSGKVESMVPVLTIPVGN